MIGLDFWPKNYTDWHKGHVEHQKLLKSRDRVASYIASKKYCSFENAKDTADWMCHTKGAYYPSWHEYRKQLLNSSMKAVKRQITEIFEKG